MSVSNPCVLLGVTGCIAAYKSCEIIRGLQKAGVRVKVVMTEHAAEFVGPTTFRALTHEPVAVGLFDDPGDPIHHISLAQECDVFLIAPCTANVVAKIAHGIADDLLSTTALATTSPLLIAPAMNVNMYEAQATQNNFEILKTRGVQFVEAESGYLACGDIGKGKLADVDVIVQTTLDLLENTLNIKRDLTGKNIMITAGPTVEPIDAVRYISNYSSGKMGYALAQVAVERGAEVTLVSGPVALEVPDGVRIVRVRTADEMLMAAKESFELSDIAIFSAAVADFKPAQSVNRKLKKGIDSKNLTHIQLEENPDILATLAAEKSACQVVVGFAAETDNVSENARQKLIKKKADIIVANEVGINKGFGADDNKAWLVANDNEVELELMSKYNLAHRILDEALCALNS